LTLLHIHGLLVSCDETGEDYHWKNGMRKLKEDIFLTLFQFAVADIRIGKIFSPDLKHDIILIYHSILLKQLTSKIHEWMKVPQGLPKCMG
jgi:hypothetical protein